MGFLGWGLSRGGLDHGLGFGLYRPNPTKSLGTDRQPRDEQDFQTTGSYRVCQR